MACTALSGCPYSPNLAELVGTYLDELNSQVQQFSLGGNTFGVK